MNPTETLRIILEEAWPDVPFAMLVITIALCEYTRRLSSNPDDKGPRFTPHGVYARPWVKRAFWATLAVTLVIWFFYKRLVLGAAPTP